MPFGLDFGGFFSGNYLMIFGLIITIVSCLIVMGLVAYLLHYIYSFNIEIEYFDRRNNANRLRRTFAKKIIEDGVPKLKIWVAKKKRFKIPDSAFVYSKGKKDKIFMTRDFDGNFNFIKTDLKEQKMEMNEVPPEARLWESLQYKKNLERFWKKTFWDNYGNLIVQYGFIIILMVLLIILFTKFNIVADSLNNAIKAAQQCQRL